jgi:hypothetical protein
MKRLFIPLTSEAFYWFRDHRKTFELRAYGRTWTEKNIYEGREVELRRGYSTGDKINGKVGAIIIGSLSHVFEEVNFKKIVPVAGSERDAVEMADEILKGRKEKYIA